MNNLTTTQLVYLAWSRGQLRYKLRPHQQVLYDKIRSVLSDKDPTKSSFVLNCARQFGKSFILFLIAVEECLRFKKHTVVFIGPLKNQVHEIINGNTYSVIFNDCPAELTPAVDFSTITFKNGSRIRLAGTDNKNYENLRGGAAHLILLDEAAFMTDLAGGVLSVVEPMTKTTDGKLIYASTPAVTPDHDFTTILREHQDAELSSTYTIWDDTSMSERQLQKAIHQCGGRDTTKFQREYECKLVTETDLAIIPEWNEKYVVEVEPDEHYKLYHKYVSMDIGTKDFTALVFGYYHFPTTTLVIEQDFVINGPLMTTNMLAQNVQRIEEELWGVNADIRKRIADNNNLILLQDLSYLHGMPFGATSKSNLPAMVNKVRMMVQAGQIKVHPRCEQLIGCLKYGIKRNVGETMEFCRSRKYGHFDALAALIYLVINIDKTTNPIPANYGIDGMSHWINPDMSNQQSQTAKMMGKILQKRRRF